RGPRVPAHGTGRCRPGSGNRQLQKPGRARRRAHEGERIMKAHISQLQSRAITALKPAIDWYQSRQAREQKVLQLLALVVALLMLVSLVWMPAWETRAQQRNSWQAQEKLRAWVAANEPVIRQLQASTGGNRMAGDWMSGLSRSAAAASVTVKSINQEADQSVRV